MRVRKHTNGEADPGSSAPPAPLRHMGAPHPRNLRAPFQAACSCDSCGHEGCAGLGRLSSSAPRSPAGTTSWLGFFPCPSCFPLLTEAPARFTCASAPASALLPGSHRRAGRGAASLESRRRRRTKPIGLRGACRHGGGWAASQQGFRCKPQVQRPEGRWPGPRLLGSRIGQGRAVPRNPSTSWAGQQHFPICFSTFNELMPSVLLTAMR